MSSILVGYFLRTKGAVAVDEAESDHRSKLNLKRLGLEQLPSKLTEMNPTLHLNLTKLFLQNNALSSLPDTLGDFLPKLRVLCLDYNRLRKLPASLPRMAHLKKLNISHNPLQGLPEVIFSLPNLKELWANSISFGIMWETRTEGLKVPREIGKLRKLRVLGLRSNRIDRLPSEFSELKSLIRVSLSGNLFQSVPLTLFELPTLVHLNLDDNLVGELLSEKSLVKAQELRYLRLCNNTIIVTTKLCKELQEIAPKLKWCLLDGCPYEQNESPGKTFKGFFKPDSRHPANSRLEQTTSAEGLNVITGGVRENGTMPVTSNNGDHQPVAEENAGVLHPLSPTTTSTTFLNLDGKLSFFSSPSHNDHNDEHSKSTEKQRNEDADAGQQTKDHPKSTQDLRQSLHGISDNENRITSGNSSSHPTISEGENCNSKHNVSIRFIDIDESHQTQSDEEKWGKSRLHCFQKISNLERVVSALPSVSRGSSLTPSNFTSFSLKSLSTYTSTTAKIDNKLELDWQQDEMENTLLLCSQRLESSSNCITSSSPVENDIPSILMIVQQKNPYSPQNPLTTIPSDQNVNRITDTFPSITEQEMKSGHSQFGFDQYFSAPATPPNRMPTQLQSLQKDIPKTTDCFREVMPKSVQQALNFGGFNAPSAESKSGGSSPNFSPSQATKTKEKKTEPRDLNQNEAHVFPSDGNCIASKLTEMKDENLMKKSSQSKDKIFPSPNLSRRKLRTPFKFRKPENLRNLISQNNDPSASCTVTRKKEDQEQNQIPCSSATNRNKICNSETIGTSAQEVVQGLGSETTLKCDRNSNLPNLKEWTWHCCPMERVKNWIVSSPSTSVEGFNVEHSNNGINVASVGLFQLHEQIVTSVVNCSKEYEVGSLVSCVEGQASATDKWSCNGILSRPQNASRRRKQIQFSDTNSYFGPEQNSEGVENIPNSTADEKRHKNNTDYQNAYPSTTNICHSETESEPMELIFESANPPNLQPSSIWAGSASVCSLLAASSNFFNINSQNSIQQSDANILPNNSNLHHPNPTAAISLIQSLLNLDQAEIGGDGNEDSFFETRDNGLELDNSELEYSPESSNIDDDEDSESVNWEQDFILREEDFNTILRPVL